MLHRTDNTRVKQQLWCPHDERVVERSEIVKGYEYRKGEYVIIEPEEIKKIEPKTAKAMEILEFVEYKEVDPIYFESSYYLVPDEAGRRPYALLTKAMEETGYVAIAKLTMHNREYTVFLRPHEGGLMLHTMYYGDEVRKLESFGPVDVELKDAEVKVAHQLIEALAGKFEPEKYHDTFEENLKELIKAHLEGTRGHRRWRSPANWLLSSILWQRSRRAWHKCRRSLPQRVAAAEKASEVKGGEEVGQGSTPEAAA